MVIPCMVRKPGEMVGWYNPWKIITAQEKLKQLEEGNSGWKKEKKLWKQQKRVEKQ